MKVQVGYFRRGTQWTRLGGLVRTKFRRIKYLVTNEFIGAISKYGVKWKNVKLSLFYRLIPNTPTKGFPNGKPEFTDIVPSNPV